MRKLLGVLVAGALAATAAGYGVASAAGVTLTRNAAAGAKFGAPGPRLCSSRSEPSKGPLTADLARAYVICDYEMDYQGGSESLELLGNVQVQIAKARPYSHIQDSFDNVDTRATIYEIKGSSVSYSCVVPGMTALPNSQLCTRNVNTHDTGTCYHTLKAEWHCTWGDLTTPMSTDTRLRVPAPTASQVE